MIDRTRLTEHFLQLVQIDSIPRHEGAIARVLAADLQALGAEVLFDEAAAKVNGEVGNLIARFPGTTTAAPLLLCAHMDTVEPGIGVHPIIEGDVIRSDGTTVLGGDDKSGVAIVVECMRLCREHGLAMPPVDVVFTICEEIGLQGARHLDLAKVRARYGLVFDSDAVGCVFTRAPGSNHIAATVRGRAAHAGMAPENGINAIQVAAEGVAAMQLGRIDFETTANIGTIAGGRAINTVPDEVVLYGEARSHDLAKLAAQTEHMCAALRAAVERHPGAAADIHVEAIYEPMHVGDDTVIMQLVRAAAAQTGRTIESAGMGGGCDANILNRRGLQVVNLGTGMRDIHTTKEWLQVSDMVAAAEVTLALIQLAAVPAPS